MMSLGLFNQTFTGDQLGAMLAAEPRACWRPSSSRSTTGCGLQAPRVRGGELRTRGVPAAVADAFSDRAHHLYLIVGPTPRAAWSSTRRQRLEMLDAMYAQMQQKGGCASRRGGGGGDVCDDLGRAFAARQFGTGEHAAVAGPSVLRSRRSWESPLPSRCSVADVDRLAAAFTARDERFNLLNNNCAHFACALLSGCGPTATAPPPTPPPRPWCAVARRGRAALPAPNPLGGGAADACSYDDCVESFMRCSPARPPRLRLRALRVGH